ncbi:MAG: hypothetical protein WC994_09490 [Brumimicrobium sp.]
MKEIKLRLLFGMVLIFILIACSEKKPVPKPPTYLQFEFPERTYEVYQDECDFSFNKPSYFNVKKSAQGLCNRDIEFKGLNGTLLFSRFDMDTSLAVYVDYALDKIGEHKVKATAIYDSVVIRDDADVYGTFFQLQGNVASPFQFYLTDSTKRFASGVVYFNTRPNYDSIRPVLNFVKTDLIELMNTFEWE